MVTRSETAGRARTKGRTPKTKTSARVATAKPKPQTKRATATARFGERSGRAGTAKLTGRSKSARPQTKPATRVDESAIRNNRTQHEILAAAAMRTPMGDGGEPMPQTVAAHLMDNLAHECIRHLRPRGSGKCTLPGFNVILERQTKPATKARPGYNPQTKQRMTIPAKPARVVVRARVGKRLLDSIGLAAS